jgi:hypothetical protein
VFFTTVQGLAPQDGDGQYDVYDARMEPGFPPVPTEAEQCAGEACHGPLTNPAPLLVPGSVSQAPGGNFAAPAPESPVSVTKAATKKTTKCRQGFARNKKGKCVHKPKPKRAGTKRRAK